MNNPAANRRVRAATISGSIAATAAIGLGASAGSADAASFDAVMVKNIAPSFGVGGHDFASVGNTLFFSADDGTNGEELWKSDGTDAGTTMVANINPGAGDSTPQYLTNVGDTLFFSATDGGDNGTTQHGKELWKSVAPFDAAHTTLVKDINQNVVCDIPNVDSGDSRPQGLANVGGALFFKACDGPQSGGTHGAEPWTSVAPFDAAHTTLVKDVNTNAAPGGNSDPGSFTDFGGTVFFGATDGTDNDPGVGGTQHGFELWKSTDGTPGNTTLVTDINLTGNSFPSQFNDVGGTLLFVATDTSYGRELWKSDGTAGNTDLVADINTTGSNGGNSYPSDFAQLGGNLFFAAYDGPQSGGTHSRELWMTAPSYTALVKDINTDPLTGGFYPGGSAPYYLTNVGGTLLFSADDGSNGRELWSSDGTGTGTNLVKDINPGTDGSDLYYPAAIGGTLFFDARTASSGRELWSSDGTATGTTQVKDINPGASDGYPTNLTDVNGTLFFAANDGNGYELWKTIPASPAGPAAPISNQFSLAGKKGNKKKGTVQYTFNLPGGGVLSEKQAGNLSAEAVASKGSVIKPASVTAAGAGPVKITIKPNKAGKSVLAQKGKLRVSVKFTFTPTGGSPASQTLKVLLKLT